MRGEIAEVCVIIIDVIARSEATKQSNFDLAMRAMDCFACARNDGFNSSFLAV